MLSPEFSEFLVLFVPVILKEDPLRSPGDQQAFDSRVRAVRFSSFE
jgi:hypothetical protein